MAQTHFSYRLAKSIRQSLESEAIKQVKDPNLFDEIKGWSREDIAILLKTQNYFTALKDISKFSYILNNICAPYLVYSKAMGNFTELVYYQRNRGNLHAMDADMIISKLHKTTHSLDSMILEINQEIIQDLLASADTVLQKDCPPEEQDILNVVNGIKEKVKCDCAKCDCGGEYWILSKDEDDKSLNIKFQGEINGIKRYIYGFFPANKILVGMKDPYLVGYVFMPFVVINPEKESQNNIVTPLEDSDIYSMCYGKKLTASGKICYGLINW